MRRDRPAATGAAMERLPAFWSIEGAAFVERREVGRLAGAVVANRTSEGWLQRESLVLLDGGDAVSSWWTDAIHVAADIVGLPVLASLAALADGALGRRGGAGDAGSTRAWGRVTPVGGLTGAGQGLGDGETADRCAFFLAQIVPRTCWSDVPGDVRRPIERLRPEHAFAPRR